MNQIQSLVAVIAMLMIGYPVLIVLLLRRLRTERVFLTDNLRAEADEAFKRGTEILATQCVDLSVEVERAREIASAATAKAERYFVKISEFERQRTDWQERYYAQSIGHGNAQELMMGTVENLARQLQALGHRPKIPSVLHALREEYRTDHEMPARAALAESGKDPVVVPQLQPTAETHPVES